MAKSIEQLFNEKQQRIAEAIKKKELRFNEQKLSIENSWAINCSIASLSEKEKELSWNKKFELIKERYPDFIQEHRIWLLDNLPVEEPPKPTRQDYAQAGAEAPHLQNLQDKADELEEEKIREEEKQKVEENLPIIEAEN